MKNIIKILLVLLTLALTVCAFVACDNDDSSSSSSSSSSSEECKHENNETMSGKAPTCTEEGYTDYTKCSGCGEEQGKEVIPATGHQNGAAATCESAQTCTVCSAVIAPALGHDMVNDEAVAPTCTTDGKEAGAHCSRCNHKTGGAVIAATHTWTSLDEAGSRECTACSNSEIYTAEALATVLAKNGKVTLMANIDVSTQLSIPAGVTVVLDMNGKTIAGAFQPESTTKHIYPISNSGTLTINGGKITGRGIYNQDGGIMTINDTIIIAEDFNGGACIWSYGGEVYINNGNFTGYCGIVSAQGYLEINGGSYICKSGIDDEGEMIGSPTYNIRAYNGLKITSGTFTSRHGVIYVGGGEATIDAGSFTIEFTATTTSNVVYVGGTSTLTINGGDFISDDTNDKADSGTALITNGDNASVIVKGGKFVGMNGMVSGNITLYGGNFNTVWNYNSYDKLADKIAAGYTATQNQEDGSWTISAENAQ